jgi:cysteinyl-tRNA synthetase
MSLIVYNTLTGKKEEFIPIKPGKISMYVCGITAYDSCHLGHARAAIVFDVVVRYLRYRGFDVTYVRNYTDVDDKIINRANKEGLSCQEISERYIKEYEEDMKGLGVLSPNIQPKATEHIPEMIEAVKKLIENGFAYESNGSVYYSVRKFVGYGKLSGKNIEELEAGARVEVDETKQDPLDFALWKASKPGEPKWPSPWGEGRPGWHIECSVMSSKYLGQPFDIHGGGRDLVFPHHENEIAQAEAACGCQFVRYWLHNGFININAEKMSKSLGNIKVIREVREIFHPEVIRYFLLSNHYRSPIDYTEENIRNAERALVGFYTSLSHILNCADIPSPPVGEGQGEGAISSPLVGLPAEALAKAGEACPERSRRGQGEGSIPSPLALARRLYGGGEGQGEGDLFKKVEDLKLRFEQAMDDDFNTALAIGSVFEVIGEIAGYVAGKKKSLTDVSKNICAEFVKIIRDEVSPVLGFFGSDPKEFRERHKQFGIRRYKLDPAKIESLIGERAKARAAKDFARADAIRNELYALNVELNDRADGTTEWSVKA